MKLSPQDRERLTRLGPSRFSGEGFLGNDPRTPEEIIADDAAELERTGVDRAILVGKLNAAYRAAKDRLGAAVEISPGIHAVFHESMGRIPSPFGGDGVFEKGEAVVTRSATGESIIITSLGVALIDRHGFFQGEGCRYRTDPAKACRVLGLT